ncbi:MAG TPA: DUF1631 domain-containing protein [Gammaproteobacteria bacterium]|nr:DUF1631 domain-containing protein [Gammaproteobacteria bacterium]
MSESIRKNVVNLEDYGQARRNTGKGPTGRALHNILEFTIDRLGKHLAGMMDVVDDALFERAEKAENNMSQTRYFDAMRELRIIRKDIEQDFIDNFRKTFERGAPRKDRAEGFAGLSLEGEGAPGLVDNQELEESLAITNLVSKIRGNCRQSLYALDKRIGLLMGDPELERHANPLGPEAICEAFRKAAERIETGLEIRLVIFKLFDKHVACHIDALYRDLNQALIQMGVMPEIRTTIRPGGSPAAGPAMGSAPAAPGAGMPGYPETGATGAAGVSPGPAHPGTGIPGSGGAPGPVFSQNHTRYMQPSISALTFLQQGGQVGEELMSPDGIPVLEPGQVGNGNVNILHGMRDAPVIRNLGEPGGMTLDIVAMLFDYILEDKNIPDAMRALIGRLQIPVLKVALLDNSFFAKKNHPARLLLNQLAATAVGWDETQGTDDPVYERIEHIVQTILEQFEDDISLFGRMLAELEAFIESEQRKAEAQAERQARVMEGKERLAVAESSTLEAIEPRIRQDESLDFVREFIAGHWKNLLFICCARDGKDSEAWKEAVATMDELIWSVKPKPTREERQKLVAIQPHLLERLRAGMQRLSVPAHEREEFIARLIRAHGRTAIENDATPTETGTRQPGADSTTEAAEPAPPPKAEQENQAKAEPQETAPQETVPEIEDAFTARARQLKPGTWMEFRGPDGQRSRAKLSWISPITGTCLFTDRAGLKAGNYSIHELAQLMRSARARLLNAAPLMDRAVRTVLQEYEKNRRGDT